jgi:hypothetical protein
MPKEQDQFTPLWTDRGWYDQNEAGDGLPYQPLTYLVGLTHTVTARRDQLGMKVRKPDYSLADDPQAA